ncbi:LacI family DNA-binding transcriptional regulator [Microbacterium karelineae]|uniref:LacI family DNA-binding transcriptional regulator n=1 Tax=Microbacterium karelineae TaxID=2654283 RepID=UPI001E2A5385|nr:LacI family DNA-binding transcriptional regulator [Microbacterium karelineae]
MNITPPADAARGRGRAGRATIADVAARAGVSTSTASLAFRGSPRVRDATRERIFAAASTLGYDGPHPVARSLRRGRSGIVGIVIAERVGLAFQNPVALATMDGLSDSLDQLGYGQLLLPGRAHARDHPDALSSLPVDAVVFATRGEQFDDLLAIMRARGVPMVGIEGPHADDVTLVEVDDRGGMRRLAERVAALGHTRVGVIMRTTQLGASLPPGPAEPIGARRDEITNRTILGRLDAVAQVFPDAVRVEAGGRDAVAGADAARVLLAREDRPTALLAQNDILAAGAIDAARELGIRVPDDLTVTGFDGIDIPWIDLPLTTVRQPLRERGREAGRLVRELLDGGRPEGTLMPVELVAGATAAPPT